ncbi:hypothetical protein TRFO_04178 [Tritrichomonas foetus]|uniref:Uncharacterized protein n=1 Tax=Tritrichomonas foetus TaxID=1144522 RepID=A0A1J4KGX6_9EUKA|nr:hypothetical protein TRFO_04178 [Tritrichomonas foetus]|eukprot:OHT10671.1 hypothetical protein TRFO_04178 [Tritrichomonas foetus]
MHSTLSPKSLKEANLPSPPNKTFNATYSFKNSKLPLLSSLFGSSSSLNPTRMSRELQRLEPRIQELEKSYQLIRQQIPLDLGVLMTKIKDNCVNLNSIMDNIQNDPVQNNSNENENYDFEEKLKELSERVLNRISEQFNPHVEKIEAEIQRRKEAGKLKGVKQHSFLDDDEDRFAEITQKTEALSDTISFEKERTKHRIELIKKNIQRIRDEYKPKDYSNDIEQINEDCNINRAEIQRIRTMIDDVKNRTTSVLTPRIKVMNKENAEIEKSNDENENQSEENENIFDFSLVPDLSTQFNELSKEISILNDEFGQSVNDLKKEVEDCEKESQEVNLIVNEVSSSTAELEAKVNESSILSAQLFEKLKILSSKIINEKEKNDIQQIIQKIQNSNHDIQTELDSIKRRMENSCTASISLGNHVKRNLVFQSHEDFDSENEKTKKENNSKITNDTITSDTIPNDKITNDKKKDTEEKTSEKKLATKNDNKARTTHSQSGERTNRLEIDNEPHINKSEPASPVDKTRKSKGKTEKGEKESSKEEVEEKGEAEKKVEKLNSLFD